MADRTDAAYLAKAVESSASAGADLEDLGEVADVFIDRLVDRLVEDGLPVYVIPTRPPGRVAALLGVRADRSPAGSA